jgi:hypothetical protein
LAPPAALENSNSIGKSKIALAIDSGFRKKLGINSALESSTAITLALLHVL